MRVKFLNAWEVRVGNPVDEGHCIDARLPHQLEVFTAEGMILAGASPATSL